MEKGCSNKGERGKLYDCIHNNPPPDVLRLNRSIKSITGYFVERRFLCLAICFGPTHFRDKRNRDIRKKNSVQLQ